MLFYCGLRIKFCIKKYLLLHSTVTKLKTFRLLSVSQFKNNNLKTINYESIKYSNGNRIKNRSVFFNL